MCILDTLDQGRINFHLNEGVQIFSQILSSTAIVGYDLVISHTTYSITLGLLTEISMQST